ncbi:hypothetical protein Q1695_015265 [Nippostrongylus brasiliensis]|nr:hypothetical protein Q1695_015265 [Nippostrongylus brasiliensis]
MGFASDWLEAAFARWTRRSAAARGAARRVLCVHGFGAFVRALAHAPDAAAAKCAALALGTLFVHLFILFRPQRIRTAQICTVLLLVVDCLSSRPGHDALFPAILAIFAIYVLLTLPFYAILAGTIVLSVLQTSIFVLFVQPLRTNEVRFRSLFVSIFFFSLSVRVLFSFLLIRVGVSSRGNFLNLRFFAFLCFCRRLTFT